MFKFIAVFIFIGSILVQFGVTGLFGLKKEKGKREQTDKTRDELKQTQTDELRSERKPSRNGDRARNHRKSRGKQDVPHASHLTNPSACRDHEFETQHKNYELKSQVLLRADVEEDDGWLSLSNGYQYKVNTNKKTWDESRDRCQSWGGDLIVYGYRDSTAYLEIARAFKLEFCWIGLSDQATEGNWRWLDGKSGNSMWLQHDPDFDTKKDCTASYFSEGTMSSFMPIAFECSYKYESICERRI